MFWCLMYGMVSAGYHEATGKFWESTFWPYFLGKVIARAALDAIKER